MKRDMNIIRELLLAIEESQEHVFCVDYSTISEFHESQLEYNLALMIDHGLVLGKIEPDRGGMNIVVERMTWDGHELLDAIREPTRWAKVSKVLTKVNSWAITTVTAVATKIATDEATAAIAELRI